MESEKSVLEDAPGGPVEKHPLANAEDTGLTLVRDDSISCGATKPVCHNYWAHQPQLLSLSAATTEAHEPNSVLHKRSHCNEKPVHLNRE